MSEFEIAHPGIVQKVDKDHIDVMVLSQSACSSCHSKSMCSLSEMKEKIIQVPKLNEMFEPGERVEVVMAESLGLFAVLLSYVVPVAVFIALIIIVVNFTQSEPLAGLISLLFLVAYYFVLYLFRKKLKKKFSFHIRKIKESSYENIDFTGDFNENEFH
jgi:positive regulator of sigma E activity